MNLPLPLPLSISILLFVITSIAEETPFDQNFIPLWGNDHITILDQGRQLQIKIDPSTGGGFRSKQSYVAGIFKINMKTPKSANGVVATFYLTSIPDNGPDGPHSELDFEMLGRSGPPILSTNVFAEDDGGREKQFNLWFDPTTDFHEYKIIWNQYLIVFFVDKIPIRVYKNYTNVGAKYPTQSMFVHGSLWNATNWLGPTDWSKGPFYANFGGFSLDGCLDISKCDASEFKQLGSQQYTAYRKVQHNSVTHDYCKGDNRHKFPECKQ